jgi:hypothetical protein
VKRRASIAGLGSATAWPLAVRAQQRPLPVVGLVSLAAADVFADDMRAFRSGRWACNSLLRMPEPKAISKRHSQLFYNSALVRS